jgi:hypothetical protein
MANPSTLPMHGTRTGKVAASRVGDGHAQADTAWDSRSGSYNQMLWMSEPDKEAAYPPE